MPFFQRTGKSRLFYKSGVNSTDRQRRDWTARGLLREQSAMGSSAKKTCFELILIKPTHYDDDGYPITWLKSHIPSNTLAALYGLGDDCRQRQVLGADVEIVIKPFDETNTRVRPKRIVADVRKAGGKALICLVGVQSNQFPRAVDLARQFLKAGLPVAMGGFHAAGCLS